MSQSIEALIIFNRITLSGGILAVDGEKLHIDAPRGFLTDDMLSKVKEHKSQIMAMCLSKNIVFAADRFRNAQAN
jgi:hypothetical protein